jgi:precorrin-2 dehydrogenase/sirohydrochlorin ferrochelatase
LNDNIPRLLPLLIDMNERKVVIFGGGQVGERKAVLFSRYAPTTVISRSFTPAIKELGRQGVSLVNTGGELSDDEIALYVRDAFLVVPTTSDLELNRKIRDIAQNNGCLVNSVDGLQDLVVPSIIERGDIILAISTGGASPALSRYMRQKLEQAIGPHFEDMARLLGEIRPVLKKEVVSQADRSRILWAILEDKDVWKALSESYELAFNISLKHITNGDN